MTDFPKYIRHKIDVLKRFYDFPTTAILLEHLIDDRYQELPHICKQCGSREFQIKDEFLGA